MNPVPGFVAIAGPCVFRDRQPNSNVLYYHKTWKGCDCLKKNALQIISICLSLVLLAVCICQGIQMQEYKTLLDRKLESLRVDINNEIHNVSYQLESALEESQRLVQDYSVEPVSVNVEEWTLETYVSVTLKEWYDDTEVTLLLEKDGKSLSLPISREYDGRFSATLPLPLDNLPHIDLDVQIRNQGKTTRETLHGLANLPQLLPLWNYGGGWTASSYENGVLSCECYINLESRGRTEDPPKVFAPVFKIYKNGELVQTQEARLDGGWSIGGTSAYTFNNPERMWHLECAEGDEFVIRFCCQDEFGLGYDFLFMSGVLDENCSVQSAYLPDMPEFQLFRPE
jgi:hypothetical protein